MSPNDTSSLVGRTIADKFVVEALIATGGSGTVYRARQPALERTVALKVLHEDVAADPQFVERFKREARAACRLDHRNSVRVLDFGHHDESLLYLAMEYVQGRTLSEVLKQEWPLADRRVVEILSQVLSAVAAAHDMEVIHRDLKPENIMIIQGQSDEGESTELAKVCDFGIATLGNVVLPGREVHPKGPSVTTDGFLVGTPAYMSPEQARGRLADRRSDLYSAGVVLFQMLAGRLPFVGDSALMVATKHITEEAPRPSSLAPVNPALEAVCLRALRKNPDDRFASAREMRTALRTAVAAPIMASDESTVLPRRPRSVDTSGRRRARPPLVAGIVLLALAGGALATRSLLRRQPGVLLPPSPAALVPLPAPALPPAPAAPAPSTTITVAAVLPEPAVPELAPRRRAAPARRQDGKHRGASRSAREVVAAPEPELPAVPPAPEPPAAPPAPTPVAAAPSPAAAAPQKKSPPVVAVARREVTLDPERGNVSVAAVTTTSAIPGSRIRAAVSRMPIQRCYRDALRASSAPVSGKATLRLRIDTDGYVTAAALEGAEFLPALKACVEKVARAARVKDVDTGEASADVTLTFAYGTPL